MILRLFVLLLIIATIALAINCISHLISQNKAPGTQESIPVDSCEGGTTERLENGLGTLSDRAVAAYQYQRMKDSLMKNGGEELSEEMMATFDKVAIHLATIGTNIKPEEVQTESKNGLPPGWDVIS